MTDQLSATTRHRLDVQGFDGIPDRRLAQVAPWLLLGVIWAFEAGHHLAGYILGGLLTAVALLVSATDICIPSMIYRAIFGRVT